MIGGYQILDLRGLNLEVTEQAQSLTDQNVLKQLTLLLRDSIDKDYNFNKPLENQLKPVLIRFRDKKNGEKIEGATFGELSVKGNYYSFLISGHLSGLLTLLLNVEFKEITNDYGNQEWVIKTATIQLIDASNILEGNVAIDGNLSVSGSISGSEIVESMTGYSVIMGSDSQNEFNPIYIGACKNGNKITFVVFGEFTKLEGTVQEPTLCDFVIPSEIYNKLYPALYDEVGRLDCKQLSAFSTRIDYVNCVGEVVKRNTPNRIGFDVYISNLVVDQKYLIRFECTFLLSDNLIPQE